jgi:hypothetical protein
MILYVKAENVKLLKRTIREKKFPLFLLSPHLLCCEIV